MTHNRQTTYRTLLLLATLILAACRSDRIEPQMAEPVDVLSRFNAEGKAWMSLDFHFDLAESTRAGNGTFAQGSTEEVSVKNGVLLLFHKGASDDEDQLELASTYTLTPDFSKDTTEPQIEPQKGQMGQFTQTITRDNLSDHDDIYLLVVLNLTNELAAKLTATSTIGQTFGQTFGQVKKEIADGINIQDGGKTYFFMSNAPLANLPGGSENPTGAKVTTLVKVDARYIFPSPEQAENYPAAAICVERAAAKVGLSIGTDCQYALLGNSHATFEAADLTFALDNYNTQYYLTRQFSSEWCAFHTPNAEGADNYRMVETEPVLTDKALYRTDWAEDINYGDGKTEDFVNYTKKAPDWKSLTEYAYCAENTFDVGHMQDSCTTSALIRLKLNDGQGFYTTSVSGTDVIFQRPDTTLTEEGTSASSSFAPRRSAYVSPIVPINEYLLQWLMQDDDVYQWVEQYASGNKHFLRLDFDTTDVAKVTVTVRQVARKDGAGKTAFDDDLKAHIEGLLANNITVTYYYGGYCYYRVPIMHFGQELTPWEPQPTMDRTDITSVYGTTGSDRDAKYLGRYGVVRNNWYTINIQDIAHVGKNTIPPLTTDPDDTVEQQIKASVTISPWTIQAQ